VGSHGGNGYSPFWVGGIAPSNATLRTVEVVVNNNFNASTCILAAYDYDWYLYGGIHRSVEWHEFVAPANLLHVDVVQPQQAAFHRTRRVDWDAAPGPVTLRVRLHDLSETTWLHDSAALAATAASDGGVVRYAPRYRGFGGPAVTAAAPLPTAVNVTVWFDYAPAAAVTFANVPVDQWGAAELTGVVVPNATVWDIASPGNQHTVHVTLTSTNLGPHTVAPCKPYGNGTTVVCLNGRPVKLLGYGRHDTHPAYGHAIGQIQRLQDHQLLQSLGGNFFRLRHYTQDREMSSLADDLGVLTTVEVVGWDTTWQQYTNPVWQAAGLAAIEEMTNDT
jgi:hypothetical protein